MSSKIIDKYRPIVSTSTLLQIFNIILKNMMISYLESNRLFRCGQFAPGKKYSTEHAVGKILIMFSLLTFHFHYVSKRTWGLNTCLCKFMGLSKAFYCVSHTNTCRKKCISTLWGICSRNSTNFICETVRSLIIGKWVPQGAVLVPIISSS